MFSHIRVSLNLLNQFMISAYVSEAHFSLVVTSPFLSVQAQPLNITGFMVPAKK